MTTMRKFSLLFTMAYNVMARLFIIIKAIYRLIFKILHGASNCGNFILHNMA